MKIVLTGGGTGGHFYPLMAVAEEINILVKERKLVEASLFYLAPEPYNRELLFENQISFYRVPAGKLRRYFSPRNLTDGLKTAWGIVVAIWRLYVLYPDVVFSKGGYASFPVIFAARFLKIPLIIHDSDSTPGRVSRWAGKFAARIALAFPSAAETFPPERVALVGNPIRRSLLYPIKQGAYEFLALDRTVPIIYITGGSQGAEIINETVLDILPSLLEHYQIIHQTGEANLDEVKKRSQVILENQLTANRYKVFANLNSTALQMTAGVAQLVVSRAGAGLIFEIAHWGIPSILVPIPEDVSHDQRTNAFTYARGGGAVVIEQQNLTPSILLSEINRLMENPELRKTMGQHARAFARPESGRLIAEEILKIALSHEE